MAKSKYEHMKRFEVDDKCLPHCWIVVRIDGRSFHRFSKKHNFVKPNDELALSLMNKCANNVMEEFEDIVISFGHSDEYSFVFHKETKIYQRCNSKLLSNVVSCFSSSYVLCWKDYFGDKPLLYPPSFDCRIVLYPTDEKLRDYLSWRQVDCHINNLHNTSFWKLVNESGMSPKDAQAKLGAMLAAEKNQLLLVQFNVIYKNLAEIFRKGTVLVRESENKYRVSGRIFEKNKVVSTLHCDIIGDDFWDERPFILK